MKKLNQNTAAVINKSKIFADNSPSVNLLLFLVFISYFVVGSDLCKEIANERNEIEIINSLLEDSIDPDIDAVLDFLKIDPPILGKYPELKLSLFTDSIFLLPDGRGPPGFYIV